MYDPTGDKIIISRNVIFNEHACWNWEKGRANPPQEARNVEVEVLPTYRLAIVRRLPVVAPLDFTKTRVTARTKHSLVVIFATSRRRLMIVS